MGQGVGVGVPRRVHGEGAGAKVTDGLFNGRVGGAAHDGAALVPVQVQVGDAPLAGQGDLGLPVFVRFAAVGDEHAYMGKGMVLHEIGEDHVPGAAEGVDGRVVQSAQADDPLLHLSVVSGGTGAVVAVVDAEVEGDVVRRRVDGPVEAAGEGVEEHLVGGGSHGHAAHGQMLDAHAVAVRDQVIVGAALARKGPLCEQRLALRGAGEIAVGKAVAADGPEFAGEDVFGHRCSPFRGLRTVYAHLPDLSMGSRPGNLLCNRNKHGMIIY